LILCLQRLQRIAMTVDASGTITTLPHFGHLPFLPLCLSSIRIGRRHFQQANLIVLCPFRSGSFCRPVGDAP